MLKSWLQKQGYSADISSDAQEAMQKIREEPFDMVLSDIKMPEIDGFEFLSWIKKYDSDVIVIMMTGYADIESAVEAMKNGAADYISKPIDPEQLFKKIKNAFEGLMKHSGEGYDIQDFIIPEGETFEEITKRINKVIFSDLNLLIIGEEGTGKSTLSKYIYQKGSKNGKPYIVFDFQFFSFNSAADSNHCKKSLEEALEKSKGGILYMQNLNKPCLTIQSMIIDLLSVKNKGRESLQLIVSTTDTEEQLSKNLLPKLKTLLFESYVELPALTGDKKRIIKFSEHFLIMANKELNKNIKKIDNNVYEALFSHKFNSNIQELKNLIFKASLTTEKDTISKEIIPALFQKSNKYVLNTNMLSDEKMINLRKENFEKQKIEEALEISKGNKTMAASILNIDRKTLYNKIRLYNIELN